MGLEKSGTNSVGGPKVENFPLQNFWTAPNPETQWGQLKGT